MIVLRLAWRSLVNRRTTALLTVASIAIGVMLLLGVEKVRHGMRTSFAGTIAGTDLIVGARSSGVQLLLYSVFRLGNAPNNVSWSSYEAIAERPEVAWIVPISLGDSHAGFRVVGTTTGYFTHYRYRRDRHLAFASGGPFDDLFDVVLGADVAAALGYRLGDRLVVAHGIGSHAGAAHTDHPFVVVGILERTATPVDRALHVSLEAIEAIHVDWRSGAPVPGRSTPPEALRAMDLTPRSVTAAFVGLTSPLATFALQRYVNDYPEEPLTAVLPGVALLELWSVVGLAERALLAVSAVAVLTAILGMITAILATLNERRREMAILRAVGARARHVFTLLVAEAALLASGGVLMGIALLYAGLAVLQPVVDARFGLYLPIGPLTVRELQLLAAVLATAILAGALPAWRAYRRSLADGMTVRS